MSLANVANAGRFAAGPLHPGLCREHLARFSRAPGEEPVRGQDPQIKGTPYLAQQSLVSAYKGGDRPLPFSVPGESFGKRWSHVQFQKQKIPGPRRGPWPPALPSTSASPLPRDLSCSRRPAGGEAGGRRHLGAGHVLVRHDGKPAGVEGMSLHAGEPGALLLLLRGPHLPGRPAPLPGAGRLRRLRRHQPLAADGVPKGLRDSLLAGGRGDVPDLPRPV